MAGVWETLGVLSSSFQLFSENVGSVASPDQVQTLNTVCVLLTVKEVASYYGPASYIYKGVSPPQSLLRVTIIFPCHSGEAVGALREMVCPASRSS